VEITESVLTKVRESHVLQNVLVDDGIACLTSVVRYLGGDVHPEMVREICGNSDSRITLLDIHTAAQSLGLQSQAYKANIQHLMKMDATAILHITNQNGSQQFIVFYGFYSPWFLMGNPVTGVQKMIPKDVVTIWQSGIMLTLRPGPDFTNMISRMLDDDKFRNRDMFSTNTKYCCDDLFTHQINSENVILYSKRTGSSFLVTAQEAQILSQLNSFEELKDHRDEILIGLDNFGKVVKRTDKTKKNYEKNKILITSALKKFVRDRLLVSEKEIVDEVNSYIAKYHDTNKINTSQGNLNTICIPTCDRPQYLKRAVTSYVKNCIKYERKIEIIVSDDSMKKSIQDQNQLSLREIETEYGISIQYLNRKSRKKYAQSLANATDVPLDVIQYGLLGEKTLFSAGASRNTFLLAAAGRRSIQVDDDTICQISETGNRRHGVRLSSGKGLHEFWFYPNLKECMDYVSDENYDFIALHENHLGKPSQEVVREGCNNITPLSLDSIRNDILGPLKETSSKVDITLSGSMGDSGTDINGNLARLFLEGDSLERLIHSENEYSLKLATRYVNKIPPQLTLTNNPHCMSMNIGLDGRNLLPPFMPVLRNEDSIFGAVHTYAFRNSYKMHLPYMILHEPPARPVHSIDISELIKSPRANDIINWLILSIMDKPRNDDSAMNLKVLGYILRDYSAMKNTEFLDHVYHIAIQIISSSLMQIEQKLELNHDSPEYWKQDVQKYLKTYQDRILDRHYFVPRDINGDQETKIGELRRHIRMYGKLLCYWPELTGAAKGITASSPLTRA